MGNHRFDLTVISDCVLDIYYRIKKLPISTGDIAVSDIIRMSPGGACATAIVARKLGLNVAVIDRVGDDAFSDALIRYLSDGGVYVGFVRRVHGFVSISNNIMGDNGHAFMGYLGVGRDLTIDDVDEDAIKSSGAIYINGFYASFTSNIVNTFINIIKMAHDHSTPVFLEVGPAIGNRELLISMIKLSSTVFMNREEVKRLFNDMNDLVKIAGNTGITFVVKLDRDGAALVSNGEVRLCRPYNISNVVTTIGAGDAFNAAYIAGYIHGLDPMDSCDLGNKVAALRIQYLTPIELPELRKLITR